MAILVLTPQDDQPSRRSAQWAAALDRRFSSLLSPFTAKSRARVEPLLRQHQHVLYFGHGEVDALVVPRRMFRSRRALIDGLNIASGRGRIVVAVACWSGDGLARTATSTVLPEKVTSYIGWRDEVSWPPEWSDPIGEAVVDGITRLLEGGTVDACVAAFKSAFDQAHERYRREGPERLPSDRAAFGKMCTTYWKERITVEGDREATL
jgi:hypothetical protein